MLEQVLKTIARFRMILPGQRISVACSGGPDSTALLLILHELSPRLGFVVSVCHFNHRLRGDESDEDSRFVQHLAERLRMPFHIQQADVHNFARMAHANLEGKARELRYGFFLSLVRAAQADRIAVGHTADDQAETVVQRLLRGAGTKGLGGIYPVVENQIIRPLIEVRRHDLLDWLKARQQPWREDASNLDLRHTRNRIRHQLLPLLSEFNPRIVETLAGTAEIARDEEAFWQAFLPELLSGSTSLQEGKILIDIGRLRQTPLAAVRRILRWAIGRVAQLPRGPGEEGNPQGWGRPEPVDFQQMQQLLLLAYEGQSGGSISLPQKVTVRKEFSHLIIEKGGDPAREFPGFFHRIQVPAKVEVPEIGSSFCFELVPFVPGQARYNGKDRSFLDRRLIGIPLTLRNWQPGDGFRPSGHGTRRKLKELFQRKRISATERQGWPVVLAENEIIWVRGLQVAEGFCPHPRSEQAILIEECRM